jgi:hypothetical protein
MTARATLIALLLLPLLPSATASAATIDSGEIVVNEGVNGATLGMKRGQVINALGKPVDENANGVMSYQDFREPGGGIFDVYRDPRRVRLFIVAFPRSGAWRLQDGNRIFKHGGIKRLYDTYGSRVSKRADKEDGSLYYVIKGRFGGRPVETAFLVDRFSKTGSHVLDVYINYR